LTEQGFYAQYFQLSINYTLRYFYYRNHMETSQGYFTSWEYSLLWGVHWADFPQTCETQISITLAEIGPDTAFPLR